MNYYLMEINGSLLFLVKAESWIDACDMVRGCRDITGLERDEIHEMKNLTINKWFRAA